MSDGSKPSLTLPALMTRDARRNAPSDRLVRPIHMQLLSTKPLRSKYSACYRAGSNHPGRRSHQRLHVGAGSPMLEVSHHLFCLGVGAYDNMDVIGSHMSSPRLSICDVPRLRESSATRPAAGHHRGHTQIAATVCVARFPNQLWEVVSACPKHCFFGRWIPEPFRVATTRKS